MQEVVLFFSGAFIGLLVYYLPTMLWLDQNGRLSNNAFKSAYPKQRYIYYLYKLLPVVWLFVYSLFVFPGIARLFQNGSLILYFVGYLLLGGLGALDGLAELVTGVAPIRPGSGARGSLGLGYLVVNDSVRRAGLLRLGLAAGIGLLSWIIIVAVF